MPGHRANLLARILHNLIEPEAIDVCFHLDPDGEVVGHLEGELGTAVVLAGEEFFDARVVDVEVERATVVGKISGTVGMCRISSFVSSG
jgi:hypothetical protein